LTIAACYVTAEGVVFGADSAASYGPGAQYNHMQKVFELGDGNCTLGVVLWGLATLVQTSYRTLFALLADDLKANPPADVMDATTRWSARYWSAYQAAIADPAALKPLYEEWRALDAKPAHVSNGQNPAGARTAEEESQYNDLRFTLTAGFCIGGYVLPDRTPAACFIIVEPSHAAAPAPSVIPINGFRFWGAPNMIHRLLFAADSDTRASILQSGHWTGTPAQLDAVLAQHSLGHPQIPVRDAIDFVHACIQSTIKAIKFSYFPRICGGPIELAVITTDRSFRWVRHKEWDTAVIEGGR
jgi:hypothetical protein